MLIGILHEGKYDKEPLVILTRNILKSLSNEDISFIAFNAKGPIINKIDVATVMFFESSSCDISIFVSDLENKRDGSKAAIIKKANELTERGLVIVTAFPEPCFEEWLIKEETAIKHMFNLPGDDPLPHSKIKNPKERLNQIIQENGKITMTKKNYYIEISNRIDVDKLSHGKYGDSQFEKFKKDLLQTMQK